VAIGISADLRSPQSPRDLLAGDDLVGYDSCLPGRRQLHGTAQPFAGSQHASRFRQFLDDERPLSCWRVESGVDLGRPGTPPRPAAGGTLRYLVGAIAHGLKAYCVPSPGQEALGRLQTLIGTLEEELASSVEVQDPIAYLDYAPYARATPDDLRHRMGRALFGREPTPSGRGRLGLHAALLTAGYNCPFVDLEAASDETLAEFPAAIFPSRGWLTLDEYGKLVVFTLRGGTLVTFPEPVTRQPDGTSFKTTFLWPHRPPQPRWTDELFRRYDAGGPAAGSIARAQVRDGTSTLIGTAPGEAYPSRRYPGIRPAARLALRRLVVSLFEERVPRQIVPDDSLEVEAIARLSPDGGCLLFVINRLGAQAGRLLFPAVTSLNVQSPVTVQVLFSHLGSAATGLHDGLALDLLPGDTMILRLR
jgi:hypothetical protein